MKEEIIEKIKLVKSKQSFDSIKDTFDKIKTYVISQLEFDYQLTMRYIDSFVSSKLGGVLGIQNKAIIYLKNKMRKNYKSKK